MAKYIRDNVLRVSLGDALKARGIGQGEPVKERLLDLAEDLPDQNEQKPLPSSINVVMEMVKAIAEDSNSAESPQDSGLNGLELIRLDNNKKLMFNGEPIFGFKCKVQVFDRGSSLDLEIEVPEKEFKSGDNSNLAEGLAEVFVGNLFTREIGRQKFIVYEKKNLTLETLSELLQNI